MDIVPSGTAVVREVRRRFQDLKHRFDCLRPREVEERKQVIVAIARMCGVLNEMIILNCADRQLRLVGMCRRLRTSLEGYLQNHV